MFSCEIMCSESCRKIFEYVWKISSFSKIASLQHYQKYFLFLVFFQGVLKADLEILSDLRWSFATVVHRWKYLSIFAKASIVLANRVPESTSAI